MSKDMIISNLLQVASKMFSQFDTEEPLISSEAKFILNNSEGKEQIFDKIINKPATGEVTVTVGGKPTKFFVEAS